MLYLLKSAEYGIDENGKEGFFFSLKIGYTEHEEDDLIKNRRLFAYFAHHKSVKLLAVIPNGTEQHEKRLHQRFKKYLWEGNEWYYYNQEIVDYFKSLTAEDLEKLPNLNNKTKLRNFKKLIDTELRNDLKYLISFLFDNEEDCENYLYILLNVFERKITLESAINYIKNDKLVNQQKLNHYLTVVNNFKTNRFSENEELNKKVVNFYNTYNSYTTMREKLRYLCEYSKSADKETLDLILYQLSGSDEVKIYYLSLGSDRLYELGYNVTRIKKELGILTFSQEILIDTIYSNFHIGDKLFLSDLKSMLSVLYESINYSKTPKATDIKDFFEIKTFKAINSKVSTEKRVNGYILVSSYEDRLRQELTETN